MEAWLKDFTLVPPDYKRRDPRQLAYNYADTIRNDERALIVYNKYVQQFIFYHSLAVAETCARSNNQILVPACVLHWRRAQELASRRVYVGRRAFYLMTPAEIKSKEMQKLKEYADGGL